MYACEVAAWEVQMGISDLAQSSRAAVVVLLSAVVVAIFVVSGLAKASDLGAFTRTVRSVLPGVGSVRTKARAVAIAVVVAELVLGGWVATGLARRWAAVAVIGSLVAFGGVALAARRQGVPCGCFGSLSSGTLGVRSAMRNLALALVALPIVLLPSGSPRGFASFGTQVLVAVGCVLALEVRRIAPEFLVPPARPGAAGIEWFDLGGR